MNLTEQKLKEIINEEIVEYLQNLTDEQLQEMILNEALPKWAQKLALAGGIAASGAGAMPSTAYASDGPSKTGITQTRQVSKSVFGNSISGAELEKAWQKDVSRRMSGDKGNPTLKLAKAIYDLMGEKGFIEFMNDSGSRLDKAPPGFKRAADAVKSGKWEDKGISSDISTNELV